MSDGFGFSCEVMREADALCSLEVVRGIVAGLHQDAVECGGYQVRFVVSVFRSYSC